MAIYALLTSSMKKMPSSAPLPTLSKRQKKENINYAQYNRILGGTKKGFINR